MLISGGVQTKTPSMTIWQGRPSTWDVALGGRWASYGQMYRDQLWVYVCIEKRAKSTARLPLKVYERDGVGRPEAAEHPYAALLRRPHPRMSTYAFWAWTSSTRDIYGEAFWAKLRDRGGRPYALMPLHPTGMRIDREDNDGRLVWCFQNAKVRIDNIPAEDIVHFRNYHPDVDHRGMSALEPLRRTLEFEDAAQRAQSAFWRKGARPGVLLSHPGKISDAAGERLKMSWNRVAGGADNTGETVVLEEGMKPERWQITADEAQYIDSRKLNREEVCAAYDMPPPAVHILDRATFSNITEQMRSVYRDTMAPLLKSWESEVEVQLRASVRPGADGPDFGDGVYAEFLLDEVLRGDFEARADAYQKGINSGWLMPSEARRYENQPFVPGSDRLLINGTMVPLRTEEDDSEFSRAEAQRISAVGQLVRAGFDPQSALEALGLSPIPHTGLLPVSMLPDTELPTPTIRSVMGRLSRVKDLSDVDVDALTAGLNGHSAAVRDAYQEALAMDEGVKGLRARIKALEAF